MENLKVSIILAAGEGTRMKSSKPKVLHEICGKPILSYVVDVCQKVEMDKTIVVVGHKSEQVRDCFSENEICFVEQPVGDEYPYGTGFAVIQTLDEFNDDDMVTVLTGDTPLITSDTLSKFLSFTEYNNYDACVMTALSENPYGYGRIVRSNNSSIEKIVEEKDANEQEKAINEINTGIFAFKGSVLKKYLYQLDTDNSQGELYLTDIIRLLQSDNGRIGGFIIGDEQEMLGINSRVQLAECDRVMRKRINEQHMMNGVTIIDPYATIIESEVSIGKDTIIYPGAVIQKGSIIGENVTIYGSTRIRKSKIGDNVVIDNSLIEESIVEDNVTIGPNAHLRPKSHLKENVHIGNFVEVKNAVIGKDTKAGHLAYIGDADIGNSVNIGCGVIFANYNGKEKFRSTVEDHAFIGSNTNIVAPVQIGKEAYIAAGSTITKEVKAGELSVERSRQKNISGWTKRQFKKN